jgi:hypothetical protein
VRTAGATNWIFRLQKSISKLIFAGYTNPIQKGLKIQYVKLNFSKFIFQKSSTDQQGVKLHSQFGVKIWAVHLFVPCGGTNKCTASEGSLRTYCSIPYTGLLGLFLF